MGFTRLFEKNGEKKCEHWSENEFTSFDENAITLIFARGWDSLGLSKKNGEKIGENWSEIEFTSFVENAITTIFDNGGDSLRFSKKMVKKTAKIGQKMNSVSYLHLPRDCCKLLMGNSCKVTQKREEDEKKLQAQSS